MTDSYILGIILIIIGAIIQLIKKFSDEYKDKIDKIPCLKKIILILSIILIVGGCAQAVYSLIRNKHFEVYASPSEVKMESNTNKPFILEISNNKDIAVYNVNISACFDSLSIDQFILDITPANIDPIPRTYFSSMGLMLSNGCSTISLHSIGPHSSKNYSVRINGQNINTDFRIAFTTYNWSSEPSLIDFPTTSEHARNLPENFYDFFDNNPEGKEKTAHGFFQRFESPLNPYFPDIKEAKVLLFRAYPNKPSE